MTAPERDDVRDPEADRPDTSSWRMHAYYYSFDRTGEPAVDRILSAVAVAGKAFHCTEFWADDYAHVYPHLRGSSHVDQIQNAASDAAACFRRALDRCAELERENAALRERAERAEAALSEAERWDDREFGP